MVKGAIWIAPNQSRYPPEYDFDGVYVQVGVPAQVQQDDPYEESAEEQQAQDVDVVDDEEMIKHSRENAPGMPHWLWRINVETH